MQLLSPTVVSMNLRRMRDDTTSTEHTGSEEPACEVCGARGHTDRTAQAQGGRLFPRRQKGEGRDCEGNTHSPATAQHPRRQQHWQAQLSQFSEMTRECSVYARSTEHTFFFYTK